MRGRPYSQLGIADLEKLVSKRPETRAIQEQVLRELQHRNTERAERLRRQLERDLEIDDAPIARPAQPLVSPRKGAGGGAQPSQVQSTTPLQHKSAPVMAATDTAHRPLTPLSDQSAGGNVAQNILRTWTVLEVLSPATFRTPADLAGNDTRRVARFDRGLPWQGGTAKGPPGMRLYFQIVLGSVAMKPAMEQLLHRFADKRPERPQVRGETPLAIVLVDREGRPIPDACAVVSSFGWGFP